MTVKHVLKLTDRSVQAFLRTQEGVSALEYAVIGVAMGAASVAFSGSMTTGRNAVGSKVGAFNPGPVPMAPAPSPF